MKLNIRFKLLLGFAVVVGLLYFVLTLGFRASEKTIKSQTQNINLEKAQNASAEILGFITKIELDNLGVARAFGKNIETCQTYLSNISAYTLQLNDFYKKISILSLSGRELFKIDRFGETATEDLGFEIPTLPFNLALDGKTGISKVYFSEDTSIPRISVFSPIFSDKGEVVGVVKAELALDRLWDLIAQVKLGKNGYAYLVDEEGRLIAHPNLDLVLQGPNFSERKIVSASLSNLKENLAEEDYYYVNEKGDRVVSNGLKIPKLDWAVIVEQPVTEAFAQLDNLRNLFFITMGGSLFLLFLISLILSEGFTRPILKLKFAAELIKQGRLDTRVEIGSGDEIEDLANSFNLMASKQKEAVEELEKKINELEEQKKRLNESSQIILKRDTELREINKQLEKEKEIILAERNKLEIIVAGITDAVVVVDPERKVIIFNKAAEEITSFKAEDVLKKSIDKVIKFFDKNEELPAEVYCPISTNVFEGVVFSRRNLKMIGAKKKELYVNLISATIKEASKVYLGCILTMHDVTKEQELEQMKLDFVSMAAHELRTPLTAIRGYASQLLEEIGEKLSPDHKKYLQRLEISANNLGQLINNLLNVSRIERGTFSIRPAPISILNLIRKVVDDFKEQAGSKRQILTFIEPKEEMPLVLADPDRIDQVFSNLLANAIAYTSQGGKITISVKSVAKNKKGNGFLSVSVKDDGQGIPKEALPKLFTKFFRVSGILEQGSKGTGLGLFICKLIIKMHQGAIWVESELGKGSTFIFTLPIVTDKDIQKLAKNRNSSLSEVIASGMILNKERHPQRRKK